MKASVNLHLFSFMGHPEGQGRQFSVPRSPTHYCYVVGHPSSALQKLTSARPPSESSSELSWGLSSGSVLVGDRGATVVVLGRGK